MSIEKVGPLNCGGQSAFPREVPEYRQLLPRSEEKYEQLRANCVRDGMIHQPLRYDEATGDLLDGYQRLDIHRADRVPFALPPVPVAGLSNRTDCLEWIF